MTKAASIRVSEEIIEAVDNRAAAMGRKRQWVIEQAIRRYLDEEGPEVLAIAEALAEYRSGNAVLIPHEEVMDRLDRMIEEEIQAKARSAT
jgi:predicted transcriptional regulator